MVDTSFGNGVTGGSKPKPNPTGGGNKPQTGGSTPSTTPSDSGSSSGQSTNPLLRYIAIGVTSIVASTTSTISNIKSVITGEKTVKEAILNDVSTKASILKETTKAISYTTKELVSNTINKLTDSFNTIKQETKKIVNNVANFVEENKETIVKGVVATTTIMVGIGLAAATVASGGTVAAVLAPAVTATTGGAVSIGATTLAVKGLAYALGLSIGVTSLSNAGEIYTGHNTIRDDIMGGNQQAYDTFQNVTNIASAWMLQTASYFNNSKQSKEFKGKEVYQDDNAFDINKVDNRGRTNLERMQNGLSPIGNDNEPLNIHHIDQTNNGPVMEITATEHSERYVELHLNTGQQLSLIDRNEFNKWRSDYWKWRANDFIK